MSQFFAILIHLLCVTISLFTGLTIEEVYEYLASHYYAIESMIEFTLSIFKIHFLLSFNVFTELLGGFYGFIFMDLNLLHDIISALHSHFVFIIRDGTTITIDIEVWVFFLLITIFVILIKNLYYRVKNIIEWLIQWIIILKKTLKGR